VSVGHNLFLDIKLKPAADLDRLEEVLVITAQKARAPDTTGLGPIRASDILAGHLPGVPQTPPQTPHSTTPSQTPPGGSAAPSKPAPATHLPVPGPSQSPAPRTVAPATGASASKPQTAKPAAKPAGSNSTAVQQPAPKTATPKPLPPNTDGSKPKPPATAGTHLQ
jgi:hypothetical protein